MLYRLLSFKAWQSLGIGIEGCLLTYEGPNSCYICELRNDYREHHGAQCLTPFTPEMPRFEVRNISRTVVIGLDTSSYRTLTNAKLRISGTWSELPCLLRGTAYNLPPPPPPPRDLQHVTTNINRYLDLEIAWKKLLNIGTLARY